MKDILRDAQEESLYINLTKTINDYIIKNPLPPSRIIRVLSNIIIGIVTNAGDQ